MTPTLRFNPHVVAAPIEDFEPVQEMLRRHPDGITFAIAAPYKSPPAHIIQAYQAALENGYVHYGPSRGLAQLKEAIARKLKAFNGIDASPDTEILVTHGAGNGFLMALQAFLTPGDEVLTADPSFPLNFGVTTLLGAVPRTFPLCAEDNFALNIDYLQKAVTPKTKLLILHNPNNPTGTVCRPEDLARLADFVIEHDLVVLSDEVYEQSVFDGHRHCSLAALDSMKGRVISLFSFSKDYSMSGARLGYLVADRPIIDVIHRIQRNDGSGANCAGQMAALAALTGPQDFLTDWLAEFDRNRNYTVKVLNRIPGVTCQKPAGGLFVFADVRRLGTSEDIWWKLIREAHVGVAPGHWYGPRGEGYIRLCYAAAPFETLQLGLGRICEVLGKLAYSKNGQTATTEKGGFMQVE